MRRYILYAILIFSVLINILRISHSDIKIRQQRHHVDLDPAQKMLSASYINILLQGWRTPLMCGHPERFKHTLPIHQVSFKYAEAILYCRASYFTIVTDIASSLKHT